MADKQTSRREYLKIDAVDPNDGKTITVQVSYDRMRTVGSRSMCHARECCFIVPEVLQTPSAIFEGLREDEDEDRSGTGWRCYCRIPSHAYHSDGTKRAAFPGKVYLVFVNDEQVAYNWRWEKADLNDAKLPENHETRFKKKLL